MIGRVWRRLLYFVRRQQFDRDLREEMALHAELRARKLSTASTDATRDARLQFGNPTVIAEQSRDVWGWTRIESILQDARFAARGFRRNPIFTASAVLTLALGIGANATIFALINAMLFKPLPVAEPKRLVQLVLRGDQIESYFCFPAFEETQRANETLDGVFTWNATQFSIGWGVDARRIDAAAASGAVYQTLGIGAQIGRLFTPEDDTLTAPPVAVISDGFWTSEFHRDPRVIGRTIQLDRQRFTIIGVTPPSFRSVNTGVAPLVTIPIHTNAQLHPKWDLLRGRNMWWLAIIGRRKAGVTEAQLQADLSTISTRVVAATIPKGLNAEEEHQFNARKLEARPAGTGLTFATERYRRPLFVLIAISALVLLIACVNLANLLQARAASRMREMSLRLALGANRSRLIRQVITESLILLAMGTAVGVAFALWSTAAAARVLSLELDLHPDARVIGFLTAIALGAGLLFGLAPAIRGTDLDAHDTMKSARIGISTRRWDSGNLLIATQVAVSLMLLIGALLFTRTFVNLERQDIGLARDNLIFVELNTERAGMNPAQLATFYDTLLRDLRALPLVRSASLTAVVPVSGSGMWDELAPALWPGLTGEQRTLYFHSVAPDYFKTMGTPLLRGRDFAASDRDVAILNDAAARTYFPGRDPIGLTFRHNDKRSYRVIGVAGNARYLDLRTAPPRTIYRMAASGTELSDSPIMSGTAWNLIIRASSDTRPVINAVRALVRTAGKDVVIAQAMQYDELVDGALKTERLVAILAAGFAIIAALLAAIGLYGVLAYTTARRTSEIGVRMALGASRQDVLWMILRRALLVAVAGAAAGIPAAILCGRTIASMLYGVRATDLGTIVAASAFMLGISAVAGLLPAWRASRVDPMTALRWE